MAPTSPPKVQPSLRTDTSTTHAGARGGPGSKGGNAQKPSLPKVSNNFGQGSKRVGRSKKGETSEKEEIPTTDGSDDSMSDDESIGKRRHRAQKRTAHKRRRAVKAREAKTLAAIPDGEVKEGLKKLEALSERPGSAAMRFASKKPQGMDTFWTLAGEDTWEEALEVSLEPKFSKDAIYLAILGDGDKISVLHSLCRVTTPLRLKGPVTGKIAAFIGETRHKRSTPNMVYFDDDTELASKRLPVVKFDKVVKHIKRLGESPTADKLVDRDDGHVKEVSPLIPVPSEWAHFFLDSPTILTAMMRVKALMMTLQASKMRRYEPLPGSLAAAACLDKVHDRSSLAIHGAHTLAYSQPVKRYAEEIWESDGESVDGSVVGDGKGTSSEEESEDDAWLTGVINNPPSDDDTNNQSSEEETPRPRRKKRKGASSGAKGQREKPATTDRWAEILCVNAANMKMLLDAHCVTGVAMAASGTNASKLSMARILALEAAAGVNEDGDPFEISKFFLEVQKEGLTVEACHAGLRRCCAPTSGSQHRTRVHVTRAMAQTAKNGNYAASNDITYEGCTAGMTPFACPYLLAKDAHDDDLESEAFNAATHKTQSDNQKFLAGKRFTPPRNVSDVLKVLNNYICWLGVMFGDWCPHLLMVIQLRDALYDLESDLDFSIDRHLCLTLLWRVHEDARRFFHHCDTWSRGEVMPRSKLRRVVDLLDEDYMVIRSLTCPFDRFFAGTTAAATGAAGATGATGKTQKEGGGGKVKADDGNPPAKDPKTKPTPTPQPTINTAIPAILAKSVAKLRVMHPSINIHKLARDSGIPAAKFIIGNGGGCTNYQVLGQCDNPACRYKHVVPAVTDTRLAEVNTALKEAMKSMKEKKDT